MQDRPHARIAGALLERHIAHSAIRLYFHHPHDLPASLLELVREQIVAVELTSQVAELRQLLAVARESVDGDLEALALREADGQLIHSPAYNP